MPHSYRTVLLERHPAGYAVLTLNRPEKLNALSMELRRELVSALEELRRDPAVRVLILTGAGRAFCAGLDLNELSQPTSANSARAFELDPVAALLQFEAPVIGAINGVAATGGFELAMVCDILLASTHAQFADTHAKVGLLPGWGLSVRLPRRIGLHRAKELAFTARFLSAAEAEAWGLVNRVVPPGELLDAARAMAEEMLAVVPEVLVQIQEAPRSEFQPPRWSSSAQRTRYGDRRQCTRRSCGDSRPLARAGTEVSLAHCERTTARTGRFRLRRKKPNIRANSRVHHGATGSTINIGVHRSRLTT